MSDLLALAERVEAAAGADRVADAAIHAIVKPKDFGGDAKHYATCPAVNRADLNYFENVGVPRYTASLDAAMTLDPPETTMVETQEHPARKKAWCRLTLFVDGFSPQSMAWAASPALARVAAALRARATHNPIEGGGL